MIDTTPARPNLGTGTPPGWYPLQARTRQGRKVAYWDGDDWAGKVRDSDWSGARPNDLHGKRALVMITIGNLALLLSVGFFPLALISLILWVASCMFATDGITAGKIEKFRTVWSWVALTTVVATPIVCIVFVLWLIQELDKIH